MSKKPKLSKQERLTKAHGTPAEFARACWNALDMITAQEAHAAIQKYERKWCDAGRERAT